MSVGFDISANTQSAQAALKQLQDAFRQLQQEGKKFTEIDLDSIGAGALNDDLKKILENWRRMTQDKGERGKAYRKEGQDKKAPWEVDPRIAYPNATEAQIKQFYQQLLDGLLRGVSGLNPDLPHPSDPTRTPTGESARELERRKRQEQAAENKKQRDQQRVQQRLEREKAEEAAESERRRQLIMGGVGGAMKFTAGMVGIQTGMQAVQAAYQGANDIGRYTDEFMRRTHDVGNGFDFLRDQVIAAGKGLGVASDEAAKLTLAFTRTAHAATIEEARAGTQAAVGLAAGFGMDKEQAVQQMARLSLIGANGSGELSTKDKKFALKIGQTVGQHNLPLEKGLSDFSRLAETAAAHSTKEPATDHLLGYLRSLYDVAHTTRTGLKGEGGMSLLAQADEGMRRADDPATNLMMFQGLSKIMGTENFLKIQRQKEEGAFAPVLNKEGQDSGQTNFSVLLEQMRKQYQHLDPLAVATVLSERLGLGGIKRGEALIEIEDTYRKQGRGGIGGYEKELADRNIRLDTLNESGIKDIGDILKQADPAERFKIANSKLNTDFAIPLEDKERKRLEGLRNEASGGDPEKQKAFIDAMIQTSAKHGMKATPYSTTEKTLAEIHSALIDTLGKTLTDISGSVSAIAQKYLGQTPEQIKAEKEYTNWQQGSRAVSEKANKEIDAAQAKVDNAPHGSPERAEAIKKLQKVQESWRPTTEAAKQEKLKAYHQQRGHIQEFIDKTFGFLTMAPGGDYPFGMEEAPEETRHPHDLRTQLKVQQIKHGALSWLWPSEENGKKRKQVEEDLSAFDPPSVQIDREIEKLKAKLDSITPPIFNDLLPTDAARQRQERYDREAPELKQKITDLEKRKADLNPLSESSPVRRASGGIIPGGVGGGDRVPALLTPGEFVINASATQKHLPLLHQINQGDGPVRFAQGGQVPGGFSPIGAEPWQNANDATPTTVRELQKRLEQLFDPVTRYLAELAQGARALKNQTGKGGTAIPGMGGNGATAADGTPIAPLIEPTSPLEETQPQLRAALARGAYPPVTPPTVHQSTGTIFPGDGRGFLSPSSNTATARKTRESRPDFVGPPTPDADTSPSVRNAQEGSTGGWNPHRGAPPSTAKAGPFAKDPRYLAHLQQLEKQHGLPSGLLYGVMMQESRGINKRVSPKGAGGLFQFMPATADRFGLKDRNDPYASAEAAAKYLKIIRNKPYVKNWDEAVAGYNAGEGRIKQYGGIPPFEETQKYVPGVKKWASAAPYREDAIPVPPLKADKAPVPPPAVEPKAEKAPVPPPSADPQVKADKAPVPPPPVASENKPVAAKIASPINEETHPALRTAKDARDTTPKKYWETDKDGKPVQIPADYTPKPLNDSPYTPKPKEPIPEPRTDSASADGAAGGVGHLNITLTQADSRGAKIGHEVNHQMNLRTPRPTGRITVASVNGAA